MGGCMGQWVGEWVRSGQMTKNLISLDLIDIIRWFKFTLKPPYSIAIGKL